MSLCSYVLLFTALAAAQPRYGVSPYVSWATRTLVRGRQPRSGLICFLCSLCSYVLLFTALAAARQRYGVSPLVY